MRGGSACAGWPISGSSPARSCELSLSISSATARPSRRTPKQLTARKLRLTIMAKKLVKVMNTAFRDGFQSCLGARVLTKDFLPALEACAAAGIDHFEFGGGARF